jgi:DNA invertase Pin-like site-specific DNA recombinase
MVQESMEAKQNKQRHQEGVALAKNSGKYVGRKKIAVDPNLFRQIAEDFRNHKVTEEEAMHRAGISSRSTFYRRLKEI